MFTGANAGVLRSCWVNNQVLERLPIEGDVTKELEKELVQLLALEKTRTASRQHKELEERILRRAEEQVASSACFSVATSLQLMACTLCARVLFPLSLNFFGWLSLCLVRHRPVRAWHLGSSPPPTSSGDVSSPW